MTLKGNKEEQYLKTLMQLRGQITREIAASERKEKDVNNEIEWQVYCLKKIAETGFVILFAACILVSVLSLICYIHFSKMRGPDEWIHWSVLIGLVPFAFWALADKFFWYAANKLEQRSEAIQEKYEISRCECIQKGKDLRLLLEQLDAEIASVSRIPEETGYLVEKRQKDGLCN